MIELLVFYVRDSNSKEVCWQSGKILWGMGGSGSEVQKSSKWGEMVAEVDFMMVKVVYIKMLV